MKKRFCYSSDEIDCSEDENFSNTLPQIAETTHNDTLNQLPIKSGEKYKFQYEQFGLWLNENNVKISLKKVALYPLVAQIIISPLLQKTPLLIKNMC